MGVVLAVVVAIPAVWLAFAGDQRSSDPAARSWTRVAHDEAVFGGPGRQTMYSVTAGGPGLVAVGSDGGEQAAAVWTSPDGVTWSRVPHDEAVFDGPGRQRMFSVTAGGPRLVAVGDDGEAPGTTVAAVWTSTDGASWSRVAHDETVFGGPGQQSMTSVTAGGAGLVAVGFDRGEQAAAVWTSPDGTSWSRVAHDERLSGGMMYSVTAGGPGLVAVGSDGREQVAAVWTSPDGNSWSRVAHDEAVFGGPGHSRIASVTVGGPGLVAVGGSGNFGEEDAAVWTSSDGVSWSRMAHDEAALGGPGSQWMESVVSGGPGLVAVGAERNQDSVGAVWTSSDGASWSRVAHDEQLFGGPDRQEMLSVASGRPGLVAVGVDVGERAAAVWIGE